MHEIGRAIAELEAYALRLKMLRWNYEQGERQSLLPAAQTYADHLRSLRIESPLELHASLNALIGEYERFAKLCLN